MAEREEDSLRREKLFGSSEEEEEEMSDLDGGDPASDNEETAKPQHNYDEESQQQQQQYEDYEESSEPKSLSKLPSFKKKSRDIDDEESARLEEVRREIRELKNDSSPRHNQAEDEEDIPVDPRQALRDEIDREFAKALKGGKKKKRKLDGEDLESSKDEELSDLRERMKRAFEEDNISNQSRKPAAAKFKMLEEATSMLTNKHLQDAILDNGLLDTIRQWLEPLPDRSLPSLDIQSQMLDVLDKLPIAGDHLRESGVGKIIYFYTKADRIEPTMKRKADQLVAKWSRLVIKRSENYKERRHQVQEYRQEETVQQRKRYRKPEEEPEEDRMRSRMHVSIPQAASADYDIAPQSTIRIDKGRTARPDGSFKRLNNAMRNIKTGSKRNTSKVSIEGKGISF